MKKLEPTNILIPEYKIDREVRALAHRISKKHKHDEKPPILVCVLNGAFMFFSDLVRDMGCECEFDFIRAKSYHGRDNSGGVTITKDVELDIKERYVYVIEDIIDTGETMRVIKRRLEDRGPNAVKVVTLLARPSQRNMADISLFEIGEDDWVVGFGLDDDGLRRNYRNIYKI